MVPLSDKSIKSLDTKRIQQELLAIQKLTNKLKKQRQAFADMNQKLGIAKEEPNLSLSKL
jgi:hypothetical protein